MMMRQEIKIKTEREIFKQAYLNLRTADSIPFPDAVFDEYVRLRDSEGYKLVPAEPTYKQLDALKNSCELFKKAGVSDLEVHGAYKAMIGAVD